MRTLDSLAFTRSDRARLIKCCKERINQTLYTSRGIKSILGINNLKGEKNYFQDKCYFNFTYNNKTTCKKLITQNELGI